jgi:hypothetical protein
MDLLIVAPDQATPPKQSGEAIPGVDSRPHPAINSMFATAQPDQSNARGGGGGRGGARGGRGHGMGVEAEVMNIGPGMRGNSKGGKSSFLTLIGLVARVQSRRPSLALITS